MTNFLRQKHLLLTSIAVAALGVSGTLTGNHIIATALGLPSYLILPGYLVQLATRRKLELTLPNLLYAIGLSLLFWLLGGLAINSILPFWHVNTPLQLRYVLALYGAAVSLLLVAIALRRPQVPCIPIALPTMAEKFAVAGAATFPALSVMGATMLNNGGSGLLSILMLVCACLYIVAVAFGHRRLRLPIFPIAIFGLASALLLMYSMRSWHVIGWDIHHEVEVYQATLVNSRWRMSYFPGLDYNACLSLTILPTVLSKLLHITPDYMFKFIYQLIFAVTPLAIYATARRFLPAVMAFLAAVLFISQNWFFELMPALARQEIAIVFFALFVLALTDVALTKSSRRGLLYAFSVAIVVSHYSTAYLWLTMCIIATICLWIIRMVTAKARGASSGLSWPLLITSAALIFLWEGPVTNTSANASSNFEGLGPQIAQAFLPTTLVSAVQSALVGPPSTTSTELSHAYNQAEINRVGPASAYYAPSTYASYTPSVIDTDVTAHDYLPEKLSSFVHLGISALKAIINNVMTIIGMGAILFYFLRRPKGASLDYLALCVAAYLMIFGALMVPYIQQIYNLPRLGLQSFALLVVPVVVGFMFVLRRMRWAVPIMMLATVITLGAQSGLIDQFTGGVQHMTLNQRGTLDSFYVYDDEIAASQWLAANMDRTQPIYTDPQGNLRLHAYGGTGSENEELFPDAIPKISYVYLTNDNTQRGYAYLAIGNDALYYNAPLAWLSSNKDLLYSAGGSEIYH